MKVLLDQVVLTDYGQLTLEEGPDTWDGEDERFFAGQVNGWVGAAVPDSVYVILARRSGGSAVRIELHDFKPELAPTSEDVVEVSIEVPAGMQASWASWAAEESGDLAFTAGTYRLRVSARGRDAGRDGEFEDSVVDWYLLEAWPAERTADAVLQSTSSDANHWNNTWGQQKSPLVADELGGRLTALVVRQAGAAWRRVGKPDRDLRSLEAKM